MTRLLLLFAVLLTYITCNAQTPRESMIGYGGMAASSHYLATKAAIKVLKQCGNAADAAVALQTVLSVVQPSRSGLGGANFILYYNHSNKEIYSLDGRGEAPNTFHGRIFCKNPDCVTNSSCNCNGTMTNPERTDGGLSVGTPGTLYSLYRLQKYFGSGSVKWKDLFSDAISIASNGFTMYQELYNDINSTTDRLSRFDASKELYLNDDNQPIVNVDDIMYNGDLAETLKALSVDPETAIELFYNGDIADAMADAIFAAENKVDYNGETTFRNGLLTKEDISGYKAVFREPAQSNYGNDENPKYRMYGAAYPSAASVSVEYLMNMMHSLINDDSNPDSSTFSNNDNDMVYSGTNAHYLITGNNVVFADVAQYMADNDFVDIPVDGLLNYTYINSRYNEYFAPQLNANNTPPIPYGIPPGTNTTISQSNFGENSQSGTTHYFIVDQWNNIASITTTITAVFGSAVVVPGYGFPLNSQLSSFDILGETSEGALVANGPEGGKKMRRTALDIFDLTDSQTFGGKRSRSPMGPMIVMDVEDNDNNIPVFSVGSPGSSTITATIFQILFNALIRNIDVQTAVDLPRVSATNDGSISIEAGWYDNNPNFEAEMELRGYDMSDSGPFNVASQGRSHAVRFVERDDGVDGFWLNGGVDDLRWSTASVESVFLYDELGNNEDVIVCPTEYNVKTLTDGERIALIVIWLIVLVIVCFGVMNRSNIKKWRQNRKGGGAYSEFTQDDEQQIENNKLTKTGNEDRL